MGFHVQTWGKTYVEYSVVPTLEKPVESPVIHLEDVAWYFELHAMWEASCNDEKWTMYFKLDDSDENPRKCRLTSYVRDNEGDHVLMISKEITPHETEIWSYTRRSFFDAYPNAKYDENELTFVFSIDFGIPNLIDIHRFETDHKSVQTSPYLDHCLCLKQLSLDLRKLMDEGPNTDVLVKCRNSIIPAHKNVLAARSEVFGAMLQSDTVEGKEKSVEIVDMEPKVLEIFIRYLYTGILPELTEDTASPLYEAGGKYHVDALRERCGDFLANNLTPENACGILVAADAHSDKDLKDRVVSYIVEEDIPKKDEWPNFCKNFPFLAIEVLNRAYKLLR